MTKVEILVQHYQTGITPGSAGCINFSCFECPFKKGCDALEKMLFKSKTYSSVSTKSVSISSIAEELKHLSTDPEILSQLRIQYPEYLL